MKNIIYIMVVKNTGDDNKNSWKEEMNVNSDLTAAEHAERTIKLFNDSLRPFEKPRELVSVQELSVNESFKTTLQHNWGKKSLVTQKGGFDVMQCKCCGATGKRYGLGPFTTIDHKFRKHKLICPGTILKNA